MSGPPEDDRALTVEIEQSWPMPLAGAFRCEPGELLALVGPSGAGTTTILRAPAAITSLTLPASIPPIANQGTPGPCDAA